VVVVRVDVPAIETAAVVIVIVVVAGMLLMLSLVLFVSVRGPMVELVLVPPMFPIPTRARF
jgi:energy-coupling factor transporter transmembrane protein EcfT